MELRDNLSLALVGTEAGFRDLETDWRALHAASGRDNPFLTYEWAAACWEHACSGRRPFIITLRERGRLVGVAPLQVERLWGFRVVRFIGMWWAEYVAFLHDPGAAGVEAALLEGLAHCRREWDLLLLRPVADDYTGVHQLPAPRALRARTSLWEIAPYLVFDGDWEALCKSGPYWLREMPKTGRRFEREGGAIECYAGAEAAARMDEIAHVEAHSWKATGGHLCFQHGPGPDLFRQAFTTLGDRMELWLARMNGEAVAFQIAFPMGKKIALYNCAYHQEYRKYSPGLLVIYHAIRRAWQAGCREYDFMTGNDPYKVERSNGRRETRHLVYHPATPRGWLAFLLLVAPRWYAKELKHFTPARNVYRWGRRLKTRIREALHQARGSLGSRSERVRTDKRPIDEVA